MPTSDAPSYSKFSSVGFSTSSSFSSSIVVAVALFLGDFWGVAGACGASFSFSCCIVGAVVLFLGYGWGGAAASGVSGASFTLSCGIVGAVAVVLGDGWGGVGTSGTVGGDDCCCSGCFVVGHFFGTGQCSVRGLIVGGRVLNAGKGGEVDYGVVLLEVGMYGSCNGEGGVWMTRFVNFAVGSGHSTGTIWYI